MIESKVKEYPKIYKLTIIYRIFLYKVMRSIKSLALGIKMPTRGPNGRFMASTNGSGSNGGRSVSSSSIGSSSSSSHSAFHVKQHQGASSNNGIKPQKVTQQSNKNIQTASTQLQENVFSNENQQQNQVKDTEAMKKWGTTDYYPCGAPGGRMC